MAALINPHLCGRSQAGARLGVGCGKGKGGKVWRRVEEGWRVDLDPRDVLNDEGEVSQAFHAVGRNPHPGVSAVGTVAGVLRNVVPRADAEQAGGK